MLPSAAEEVPPKDDVCPESARLRPCRDKNLTEPAQTRRPDYMFIPDRARAGIV